MSYSPSFTRTYPNGWKDRPDTSTPAYASTFEKYENTFEAIEAFLDGAEALKPVNKTSAMTQDVGFDPLTGKLYTKPGSGGSGSSTASGVSYDNTQSELQSTNVQGAIDEVKELATAIQPVAKTSGMTQPVGLDNEGKLFTTPGGGGGGGTAASTTYDNTESELESTDVQGAIDELAAGAGEKVTPVPKTEDMTQEVGIDENGELWTAPGGGGSGSATKIDTLFEDTTYEGVTSGTINLSRPVTDYDFINFTVVMASSGHDLRNSVSYDIDTITDYIINSNKIMTLVGYGEYINLRFSDTQTITVDSVQNLGVVKIVGIKYGSGGGSVFDETVILDTPVQAVASTPITLDEAVTNYDQIRIRAYMLFNGMKLWSDNLFQSDDFILGDTTDQHWIFIDGNDLCYFSMSADGTQLVMTSVAGSVYIGEVIGIKYSGGGGGGTASDTSYDNTQSGLTADDVQSAIDELASDFQDGCDTIVQAVTAKGQTPASNSPQDIATAIENITTSSYVNSLSMYGYTADTAHTFTIDEAGTYLMMLAISYQSTGSITLPQSATILSTVDEDVGGGRRVLCYIAELDANDMVVYNVSLSNWAGRIEAIIKLDSIKSIQYEDFNGTSDGTTNYTLPNDGSLYLVYGLAVSRAGQSRDDSTNVGKEKEHISDNWGYSSVSRVAICTGSDSPNYSFYGYDGGFSAVVVWKIQKGESLVTDGLIRWYDAIDNTLNGHDTTSLVWEDLTETGDATVSSVNVWSDKCVLPDNGAITSDFTYYDPQGRKVSIDVYANVYPRSSGWQTLIDLANQGGLYIGIEGHTLKAGIHNGSNYAYITYPINEIQKIHVVFIHDDVAHTETLYVNGVEIETRALADLRTVQQPMYIGRSDSGLDILQGSIYDVKVYNKALSAAEVQKNYQYDKNRFMD